MAAILGISAFYHDSAAALVVFMFAIGDWLESLTIARANHALRDLARLAPATLTKMMTAYVALVDRLAAARDMAVLDAAADHGIDAFIFDWYYYNDGPFLDRPIDHGFLKAENNTRLKFAFMWANHDWLEIHPYKRGTKQQILYPGTVTPENFAKICDHVIKDYFQHPSYWRIEGKPYFSFYDLGKLLESFGSFWASSFKEVIVFTLIIPVLLWRSYSFVQTEEEDEE